MMDRPQFCFVHKRSFSGIRCPECMAEDSPAQKEYQQCRIALRERIRLYIPDMRASSLIEITTTMRQYTRMLELTGDNEIARGMVMFDMKNILIEEVKAFIQSYEVK